MMIRHSSWPRGSAIARDRSMPSVGTAMRRNKLYDANGQEVLLGAELGRGGEGSVISLPAYPNYVAKLYHTPVDAERAAKLRAMVQLRTDRLLRLAAWPVATLHTMHGGPVTGFIMPNANGFK